MSVVSPFISAPMPSGRPFDYEPPKDGPEVIFQDDTLLILNKPAGLLSVKGKQPGFEDCMTRRAQTITPYIRLVHRLDMATSGIMVFAKTDAAQRHLGQQFEQRRLSKSYIADVAGDVVGESGHINLPLICDWPNRPRQRVDFETGKPSQTDWEVMSRHANFTRLKLHPITGRSHQLRVHMLAIGHPILGDRIYADDATFSAVERLHLHAYDITLRHPDGGDWHTFTAPCPF